MTSRGRPRAGARTGGRARERTRTRAEERAGEREAEPVFAAKQDRSRQTLDRLLAAAEAVLASRGLDEATVPAIAERAGLSVGVVYRRFKDKDALMRAVYERFFASSREQNRAALDPARWAGVSAAAISRAAIEGVVRGYRQHRGLLRALFAYADAHPDARFRRRAEELNGEVFRQLAELLLARREQLAHPQPDRAIRFGLIVVASALRRLLLAEEGLRQLEGRTDEQIAGELTRMYSRYLGIADTDAAR